MRLVFTYLLLAALTPACAQSYCVAPGGFGGGGFDAKMANNGVFADAAAFNQKVHLLWLGIGTQEPPNMHASVAHYHDALEKAGIKTVYYEAPGTAHEWQTSRRDLKEITPLLFR